MDKVVLEIKSGEGGMESCIFVQELLSMYLSFCSKNGWKVELVENIWLKDALKDVSLIITGEEVHKTLKGESGGHRVQRVPKTENKGRVHTSVAKVAVYKVPEKGKVTISPDDLAIDTYRSKGKGGQGVNTTDSAVRITHKPSGIVVTCQNERSQLQNKTSAMEVLLSKLYDKHEKDRVDKIASISSKLSGSGERGDKVRTYNFNQDRVTNHRNNKTISGIKRVLNGNIEELIKR